jgi:hypothetical protein
VAGTNSGALGDSSSMLLRLRRPDAGERAAVEAGYVLFVAVEAVLGGADMAACLMSVY